jgi:site-specific DNA recombinase
MSLAAIGDTTKVDDQERICRELAAHLDWPIAEVYTDNSRSAWQRNRKREDWERMLTDVDRGRINALLIYHGDRLIRQPFDLETLLNLSDGKGVRLAAPTGTRNLDSAEDRFILRIEAAMACRESDNTSRRRKAQYVRWRREGRVRPGGPGGRPFGFATDGVTHLPPDRWDVATREPVTEADLIREMAARITDGEHAKAIARDVTARGWRTPAGKEFTHTTIRSMLSRGRYAGLMPGGVSAAAWQPILDRQTWEETKAVLDRKAAGFASATNRRRYLLSGIATCGVCGSSLEVKTQYPRGTTAYRCTNPGCRKTHRSVALLDAYVTGAVTERLSNPANPEGVLPSVPGLAAEWRRLGEDRAALEAMIKDHTRGGSVHLLLARLDSLDDRLDELRELTRGDAAARLRGTHTGITPEEFGALPLGTRRALVPAVYREVVVLPASRRGPGFRTEDVRLVPRVGIPRAGSDEVSGDRGAEPDSDRGDEPDDFQGARGAGAAAVGGGDTGPEA